MAQNTIKAAPKEPEIAETKSGTGTGVFSIVDKYLPIGRVFEDGIPVKYVPKVLFGAFVMMLYIANAHYGDRLVRKTTRLKNEVNDLRADYTTLKADLMLKSKQSEVAKQVAPIGLEESTEPPVKITEKQHEH